MQPINPGEENTLELPRLLYFTTEYPHVSHTFIRREILGLEKSGYEIHRAALKPGSMILSESDIAENSKTFHILDQSAVALLKQVTRGILRARFRLIKALPTIFKFSRASDRGLLKHVGYLAEALVLLEFASDHNIDQIHVHFGTNAATVAYLSHQMGGPRFSMTIHGPVEFDQPYGQSLTAKLSAACFVLAITSFCRSQLYRWAPVSVWENIHIVGCSVGDEWFDAAHPLDQNSSGIVCVGRLDEQKGQLLLVDALADAIAAGYDENLTIIGDGPFREAIEARVAARGLTDRVNLVGWRDASEIRTYLLASKALVLASFAEGLPVVIMEAMALCRPVLATRITGIPELVRDNTDGWLVTPGSQTDLTEALVQLGQRDIDQLNEMGRAAQKQVRARHFTPDIVAKIDRILRKQNAR